MLPTPRRQIWAALEQGEVYRDAASLHLEARLPENPGIVHALGTSVRGTSKALEHFEHDGPRAVCGRHVKVRLPLAFSDQDPDACARCVELVRQGETWPPDSGWSGQCSATVAPVMEGFSQMVGCMKTDGHRGPHRTNEGAIWFEGPDDFTPNGNFSA